MNFHNNRNNKRRNDSSISDGLLIGPIIQIN